MVRRAQCEVDLVRSGASEADMRALTVVPISEERQLLPDGAPPDGRRRSLLVEPGHPGDDGRLRDDESLGSLRRRSTASRAELENREALDRRIVRAAIRRDALHASVLDAQLLVE
jgi:hypothetical protein